MKHLVLGCVAAPLLTAACAGLDTGNADLGTIEFSLSVTGNDPVDQSGNVFVLESVTANVRDFEFYLPAGVGCSGAPFCDGEKIDVEGPFTVDLLDPSASDLPAVVVPVGTYRRVDVRFDDAEDDITLRATGTVMIDGTARPFRLEVELNERARFEGAIGVTVEADALQEMLLRFDPIAWFQSLPLVQCATSGDLPTENGVLVIRDGEGACDDIEDVLEEAIEASGTID